MSIYYEEHLIQINDEQQLNYHQNHLDPNYINIKMNIYTYKSPASSGFSSIIIYRMTLVVSQ